MATEMERTEPPLIVIVGPTASGKTALAVDLAERLSGEVICADSRTVYKGIGIGTAKPSAEEQKRVPHWGLDLVEPNQPFNVYDFKAYATAAIASIRHRGNIPFLVGGTGLYTDAVLFDYQFLQTPDTNRRNKLASMTVKELQEYCIKNNIDLPENSSNKRHLIHTIERKGHTLQRRTMPIENSIVVGIATEKAVLVERIAQRSEHLFSQSLVDEAKKVGEKYGWEHEALTGNVYPLLKLYLENEENLSDVKQKFIYSDKKLAKRQLTWFRRNPYIMWLTLDEVESYIERMLMGE